MIFKIVADSSCDLDEDLKKALNVELVPLSMRIGDREYVDDEQLNVGEYIQDMNESKTAPKSASPAPHDFLKRYAGDEKVFVVTLSSKLSATYNSAILAKSMYLEQFGDKFIHVFDSLSASVGETLICLKISELAKKGLGETEIVDKVNTFTKEMRTFFLLESLEHFVKAGRVNPFIAKVASVLSIKPVLGSDGAGEIKLFDKVRGQKKAFARFIEIIGEEGINLEEKVLAIAHCNCPEKAISFKEEVLKRYNFKDIVIVKMGGLSSTYADDGGIVIAF